MELICGFELSITHAVWHCCDAWHIPGTVTVRGPGDNPLSVRMPMAMAMLMKTTPTTASMATQPACLPQISGNSQITIFNTCIPQYVLLPMEVAADLSERASSEISGLRKT